MHLPCLGHLQHACELAAAGCMLTLPCWAQIERLPTFFKHRDNNYFPA